MGGGGPAPTGYSPGGGGVRGASYDNAQMPGYAWPSYAAYPNYAAVTYPQQYSPTAWPYIGPFYPYPQVPLAGGRCRWNGTTAGGSSTSATAARTTKLRACESICDRELRLRHNAPVAISIRGGGFACARVMQVDCIAAERPFFRHNRKNPQVFSRLTR